MVKQTKSPQAQGESVRSMRSMVVRLLGISLALSLTFLPSCGDNNPIPPLAYACETSPALSPDPGDGTKCGDGDADLVGMEPAFPTDICQTLTANRSASDMSPPGEENQDTIRIQAALD